MATTGPWSRYFVLLELALTIGGSGLALGMIWIGVQSEVAAVRRVFFFLDMEVEEPRAKGVPLRPIREGVRFDRASLRYANGHQALRDVSLDLNVGELVAKADGPYRRFVELQGGEARPVI